MLRLRAGDQVVSAVLLVCGDEVRAVHARQRNHLLHDRVQLALQVVVQNLGARHGVAQVHAGDVPAANHELRRVDHGQQLVERHVHVLAVGGNANAHGGGLRQAAPVVRRVLARLGAPRDAHLVRQDAGRDRGAVVAAQADDHHARARHIALRGDDETALDGGRDDDGGSRGALLNNGALSRAVAVVRHDAGRRVRHVRAADFQQGAGWAMRHLAG
mmetsp:Transcript_55488/g.133834  ORF Transcript_55488/g.133834 Transcript_55488/m.133834 type:complete len:216 (+) Transcript_55488:1114-1761(+)